MKLRGKHYMTPDAKNALESLPSLITDTLCQTCGATCSMDGGNDGGFTAYNIAESADEDGVHSVLNCNRCKDRTQ